MKGLPGSLLYKVEANLSYLHYNFEASLSKKNNTPLRHSYFWDSQPHDKCFPAQYFSFLNSTQQNVSLKLSL